MGTSRGLDVSVYQGPQDWAQHKKDGAAFAWAKASEGEHTRDAHFAEHITGIIKAGLIPGGYHFAWPNQDFAKEAANYVAAVKPYAKPGFVHWLDLERRSDGKNYAGVSNAQIQVWVSRWIAAVQKAYPGQRVGIYTSGDDIAKGHVPTGTTIWYPAYPGTRVDTYAEAEHATRPAPSGRTVTFWQFTSNPAGPGPNLDLNLCYKSAAELRTWAGGATTPAPAPKPAPKPTVDLSNVIAAAKGDHKRRQGDGLHEEDVKHVEAALHAEGLLAAQYSADGYFGTATLTAYAKWQRRCGYTSPSAADGIPGKTTLTKLGQRHGFSVVA